MTFGISQMLSSSHAEHLRTVLLRCERLGLVNICAANSKVLADWSLQRTADP